MENRQIIVKIRTFQYQFTHSNARYPTSYLISDLEFCAYSENQSQNHGYQNAWPPRNRSTRRRHRCKLIKIDGVL